MVYTIYYTFNNELINDYNVDVTDYAYSVEPNIQDIVEYYYEKTFRRAYSYLSWYLEPGAKELVKELETKWLKNQIDTHVLYHDYEFIDWLKNKYHFTALNKASLEMMEEDREDEEYDDEEDTKEIVSCYHALCRGNYDF